MNGISNLYDVVGIGNAMVDVLYQADEAFLIKHGLIKGSMRLVDYVQAEQIYSDMTSTEEMSGGSVGNTMAAIASLGGKCSYIGKISDDHSGEVFRSDMAALGVDFSVTSANTNSSTAICLVVITPDGQRTMATYLGACLDLTTEDINSDVIVNHKITYLEGYLWDTDNAKEAMIKAAKVARTAGCQVALSLSDSFCVERHRDSFRDLISEYVDILFGNEEEMTALYQEDSVDKAIDKGRNDASVLVTTLGNKGSVINASGTILNIEPCRTEDVVDTTGAGDLYAAGFLYGMTNGYDMRSSGMLGSMAAGEIIKQVGARPKSVLSKLTQNI
ncbi:MAG: adenosine kinase [SAR202 cluster bacterium]|nr:adenosine kinase [SAR202 cluster bacterium]|tara:strand:- start:10261 stop:11253 length:993 start_codon:yes stop_codon:yes gene_type:complete